MSLDLHSYLDKFAAVCDRQFDRQYDLDQLEKRLAIHRDGKYFLTACLFDDDATPFAKYWPRAHAKVVEAGIPRCRPAALVRIASEELFAFRSTNCRSAVATCSGTSQMPTSGPEELQDCPSTTQNRRQTPKR